MWCTALIVFLVLNHSCFPGMNPTKPWYIILGCWICFASFLLRVFCMYINEGYWSVIFFSLCGFSIGGIMQASLLLLEPMTPPSPQGLCTCYFEHPSPASSIWRSSSGCFPNVTTSESLPSQPCLTVTPSWAEGRGKWGVPVKWA